MSTQPTVTHTPAQPFMHSVWHVLKAHGPMTLDALKAAFPEEKPVRVRAALYNLITRNSAHSNGAQGGGRVTYTATGEPPTVKPPAFGNGPRTHMRAQKPSKPSKPKPTNPAHAPYALALPREIHVMHTPVLQSTTKNTTHIEPARLDAFKRPSRVGDRLHWPDGRVTDLKGNAA